MQKLARGQIFNGRYRIDGELGSGGMGDVYLARQLDADRNVALKILKPERIGKEGEYERFLREFQVLSQLSHPNIVAFYAIGLSREGIPYAACEYIEGTTVQEILLRENRLSWQRSIKIILQIAEGLAYAHSLGIIHRDLKPGNIIISNLPEPDTAKIIDFGLARIENRKDLETLTSTGTLLGSVHYMSPEQCRAEKLDSRSDIYALGCILFELLSGEKLFTSDNPVAVLHMHATKEATKRLRILDQYAPSSLQALLRRILAKDKTQRQDSMLELCRELGGILQENTQVEQLTKIVKNPAKSNLKIYSLSLLAIFITAMGFNIISKSNNWMSPKKPVTPAPEHSKKIQLRRRYTPMIEDLMRAYPNDDDAIQTLTESWLKTFGKNPHVDIKDKVEAVLELARIQKSSSSLEETLTLAPSLIKSLKPSDELERNLRSKLLIEMSRVDMFNGNRKAAVEKIIEAASPYKSAELRREDSPLEECVTAYTSLGEFKRGLSLQTRILKETTTRVHDFAEMKEKAADLCILLDDPINALNYYKSAYTDLKAILDEREALKQANNRMMRDPVITPIGGPQKLSYAEEMAKIADKIGYLDRKIAKEYLQETLQISMQELEQGFQLSSDALFYMEEKAEILETKLPALWQQRHIELLKGDIRRETQEFNRYQLACKLSKVLAKSKQQEAAVQTFQNAELRYKRSLNPDKLLIIRNQLEFASELANFNRIQAEVIYRDAIQIRKTSPSIFRTASVDSLIARYFRKTNNPLAKDFEQRCFEESMADLSTSDWVIACSHLISSKQFAMVRKICEAHQSKSKIDYFRQMAALAANELNSGLSSEAEADFNKAYAAYFSTEITPKEWPKLLIACKLGQIAARAKYQIHNPGISTQASEPGK
ncbi:MAG: serine/threonine protein kinase [Candidatus Obscuribacterales bacterium]|nr:serine/threonine protein kinase [Candidatus Obscuribacterales bacterium]